MSAIDLSLVRSRIARVTPRPSGEPRAAVAAVLRQREQPEILFIQRAEHPGDPWSGHLAFPGGRHDATDPNLRFTAERETREELGLDLTAYGEPLGQLDDVPTHTTGLVVRPFVYAVDTLPELQPNYEVADVFWVDLPSLLSGARDTEYPLVWKGQAMRFPGYAVGERVVWGLTYRMLQILFEALRG